MKIVNRSQISGVLLPAMAIAFVSGPAVSSEPQVISSEPQVIRSELTASTITVTARSQKIETAPPRIDSDMSAIVDSLEERLLRDLAREIEFSGLPRFELVMAEVPTRG